MSQINAEFGKGNDLNSYRGTTWYTDAGGSGTFSTGAISYTDFYGKRVSAPAPSSIDVLVVAGGGSGGRGDQNCECGGGGGGGLCEHWGRSISAGTTYTITVGAGGAGSDTFWVNNNGSNSIFDTITAIGGGHGLSGPGGCGGGGWVDNGYHNGASATQGNSGGATGYGYRGGDWLGYGNPNMIGGGAGSDGNNRGSGRSNSITGSSVTYSAGGYGSMVDGYRIGSANSGWGGEGGGY